jgi:hypothetical protein
MVTWFHEKPIVNVNASGGQPRAFALHGSASSGSRCRDEDSGFAADTGGAASGMDCRSFGDDAAEFESVDAQGKRAGAKDAGPDKAAGASRPLNAQSAAGIGSSLRAVTLRVWAESGSVGRPHRSSPPKAPVWDSAESSTAQAWMHQLGYRLKRAGYSQARSAEAKRFRRTLKKTSVPEAGGDDCL